MAATFVFQHSEKITILSLSHNLKADSTALFKEKANPIALWQYIFAFFLHIALFTRALLGTLEHCGVLFLTFMPIFMEEAHNKKQ